MNNIYLLILGTRPSFIMGWGLIESAKNSNLIDLYVVHTGQHYDDSLSRFILNDLGIQEPDYKSFSTSEEYSNGELLERLCKYIKRINPRGVIVLGDTNTNLIGAVSASICGIDIIHVEAGERSFDLRYSIEERNRKMIDSVSQLFFVTNTWSKDNLIREGVDERLIHTVGNPIIDAFFRIPDAGNEFLDSLNLTTNSFVVLTLHRAENCTRDSIFRILDFVNKLSGLYDCPCVFGVHPRVRKLLDSWNHPDSRWENIRFVLPFGYRQFKSLIKNAKFIISDSGGVQQESYLADKPHITVMKATPWSVLDDIGHSYSFDPELLATEGSDFIISNSVGFIDEWRPSLVKNVFGEVSVGDKIISVLEDQL